MASAVHHTDEGKPTFGHPRGLLFIAGTELWDRVSFHGMQALLVLYMVEQLLLPGHVEHVAGFAAFRHAIESVTGPLSAQALAFQIFGLYIGLVYFTPVFGGALGDCVLGRVRTVSLGALLMTAGISASPSISRSCWRCCC
jgi:POT family proton-dependent oligopeptide transporter